MPKSFQSALCAYRFFGRGYGCSPSHCPARAIECLDNFLPGSTTARSPVALSAPLRQRTCLPIEILPDGKISSSADRSTGQELSKAHSEGLPPRDGPNWIGCHSLGETIAGDLQRIPESCCVSSWVSNKAEPPRLRFRIPQRSDLAGNDCSMKPLG